MLFCDKKWAKGFLGQDGNRLAAGRSLLQGLASTPRRRGVPFTRVCRRGLRSMSGHPAYAWGNPPTLRRSSFPQRASRPAGGPIPKHAWGCAPRPPNAKLRLDTNDAKASSVRRRRYAPKVPAAHFILAPAGTELKLPPYKRRLAPDPGGCRPSGRGKWGPRKVARPCGERRMHCSGEGCRSKA